MKVDFQFYGSWVRKVLLVLILLITGDTHLSIAQTEVPPLPDVQSTVEARESSPVHVGLYLIRISSLSLRKNQFGVDFYLWFRWDDNRLKPHETFELMNGTIERRDLIEDETIDGHHYACLRIHATITKYWDILNYPFDIHTLAIEIEDRKEDRFTMIYVADSENSAIDSNVSVTGWDLVDFGTQATTYRYQTNYGDTSVRSDHESYYSRFIGSVKLKHPGVLFAVKKFYGLYIAVFTGLGALLIKAKHSSPRFGLGVAAVFTIVGNHFVVTSHMPETGQLTLVDRLHIFAGLTILITIGISILSVGLSGRGQERLASQLDRIGFVLFLLIFAVGNFRVFS